jgi:hypothetical protein
MFKNQFHQHQEAKNMPNRVIHQTSIIRPVKITEAIRITIWFGGSQVPLRAARSFSGIISYLTGKHGACVHHKVIVAVTSKSDEKRTWACWDFQGMRVRPTHYTVCSTHSSVVRWNREF